MDKKWSQIGELENLQDREIKLCAVIKATPDESKTGYINKLVSTEIILKNINADILDLSERVKSLELQGFQELFIVGVEPAPWWENEDDKIPNISIAKDLRKEIELIKNNYIKIEDIDKTVTSVNFVNDVKASLMAELEELDQYIQQLDNNCVKKYQITQEILDRDDLVPSSKVIFNLNKYVRNNIESIQELREDIKNINIKELVFDTSITEDSEVPEDYSLEHFYININDGTIFAINYNEDDQTKSFKKLALTEEEIIELIQVYIEYHNTENYNGNYKESHANFRGKMVGKPINEVNEIFNDYENNIINVPELNNYSSIHNKNNQIGIDQFELNVELYDSDNDEIGGDSYGFFLKSNSPEVDLLDFDGYYIHFIDFDTSAWYTKGTPQYYRNTFKIHKGINHREERALIFSGKLSDDVSKKEDITAHYFSIDALTKSEEYGVFINDNFFGDDYDVILSKSPFIDNADINFDNPIFLAGDSNRAVKGNQTIFGKFNTPSKSVFIIGNGESDTNRDNIFEIAQSGAIYGYLNIDNKLVYTNISKYIENLKKQVNNQASQIHSLSSTISTLQTSLSNLEERIVTLENN